MTNQRRPAYSAFYRVPLGTGQSLRELYDQMPVTFGYDQVTHQFNLPAPTGRPDLIFYASGSSTEIPTRYGPLRVLTNTELLTLSEQTAERDLTINGNLGLKLTVPLQDFGGIHFLLQRRLRLQIVSIERLRYESFVRFPLRDK